MTDDPGRDCGSSLKYFSIIGIDWKVLSPIPLSQLVIDLKHAGLDPFYVFKTEMHSLRCSNLQNLPVFCWREDILGKRGGGRL